MYQNKPILIVSPPRSGSSLTGYILNTTGVFGGKMKPADKWNIRGYFENIEITHLLVEYMREHDHENSGKRFNPTDLSFDFPNFDKAIYKILRDEGYDGHGQWFYKNPKIAYCWRLFQRYFPDAKWIVVNRDRKETLDSIMRTEFMDGYETKKDWNEYLDRYELLIGHIKQICNTHDFNINAAINNDVQEIEKLLQFIGKEYYSDVMSCILKPYWNEKK